ncbi:GNAT domain [Dillenia turbinata]|uniref:GNAT domain n=1 Tax=Dillenia turbinata TaxID=194707 RepID=A0AAN8Z7V9_9MAGN
MEMSTTQNLTLRQFKLTDADDFMSLVGDEKVTKFTRWKTFTSKQEALSYIGDVCIPHPFCRSICMDDQCIGYVSVTPGSGDNSCRAEIGYALAAKYWGKGIIPKALKMAMSMVFKEFPNLVRLQAFVEVENKASQRVLDKTGFQKEGVLRKISLRPFRLSDADDFMSWARDDRVTKYLRWNTITSREEALAHLREVAIPHPWRRSICLDDRSIGYISIKQESGGDKHRANIGYGVGVEYWGQGIVTVALKLALSSVFNELPDLVRIQAYVEEENKGSQRVLEKVGFKKEGPIPREEC